MIIDKISTKKEDIVLTGITLLSEEEYLEYKDKITAVNKHWWLRSPGRTDILAAYVFGEDGFVDVNGDYAGFAFGVRPALCIGDLKSLQVGDKFELAKYSWTIISDKYALCDYVIGHSAFQKGKPNIGRFNDYETSDVKQYVESWAKENGIEFDKELDDNLEDDLEG